MTEPTDGSVPTDHFETLYANSDDPWAYETGDYERRKYALTLDALPRQRYAAAFELGCSIGVLTNMLALRCDTVLGGDCSAKAIELARAKHPAPNIEYRVMRAPQELPAGCRFDLIVLSEVLYFFSPEDLAAVAAFVRSATNPGGNVMLVNYLGPTGHAASGDDAADGLIARLGRNAMLIQQIREPHFRVDVLALAAADGA
jgi:SAM-dependent methyltransferase